METDNAPSDGGAIERGRRVYLGNKEMSTFPWIVVTTASISAGMLCLLPFAAGELWLYGMPHLHLDGVMQLLYLGGISSALGYGLWNYGLRVLDAL